MGIIGSHLDLTSGRLGYQAQSAAGVCGQEKERQSECPESHSRQWYLIPPYYWEGWRLISPKACCRVEKYVVRWKTGGPLLSLEMPKRDHGLGGLCTSHIVWDASEAGIARSNRVRMKGRKSVVNRGLMTLINLTVLAAGLISPLAINRLTAQEFFDRGQIVDRSSGQCLTVRESREDGAAITQWPCNREEERQRWTVRRSGEIVSRFNGKCLGIGGGSLQNGKAVIQWTCNGHESQQWQLQKSGEIVNRNSRKCMGVNGGSRERGADVVQWDCNDHEDQKWSVQIR